ncbi:unnamed protein product, partial [Urochloa humidicola]
VSIGPLLPPVGDTTSQVGLFISIRSSAAPFFYSSFDSCSSLSGGYWSGPSLVFRRMVVAPAAPLPAAGGGGGRGSPDSQNLDRACAGVGATGTIVHLYMLVATNTAPAARRMATNMYGGATVACRVCYRDQYGTLRELSCTPQRKWMNGYHLTFRLCQWNPNGGRSDGHLLRRGCGVKCRSCGSCNGIARLESVRVLKMAPVLTEISNNIQGEILNFQMTKLHLRRSQPMLVKGWPKPANSFTMMQSL